MSLPCPPRDPERGAALVLTLVAVTALLGLGALTVLGVRSELVASGQSRFSQAAVYAAESGAAAGMEFLRTNCSTQTLFSQWMSASNESPPSPEDIVGNGKEPGTEGNPFAGENWYEVSILNNVNDPGFPTAADTDGIVVLRATGYGPDQTVAIVELEVRNNLCLTDFCAQSYAQRGMSAHNDANAACSAQVAAGALRTMTP